MFVVDNFQFVHLGWISGFGDMLLILTLLRDAFVWVLFYLGICFTLVLPVVTLFAPGMRVLLCLGFIVVLVRV